MKTPTSKVKYRPDSKPLAARERQTKESDRTVYQSKSLRTSKESANRSLTALPATVDVATLAQLYNSPLASHIAREDLLEQARKSLMKYELAEADMEIAADSLARSMHLLLEQHGLKELLPEHMAELERHVLEWYGLSQPESDSGAILISEPGRDTKQATLSEVTVRRPETVTMHNHKPHAHGTPRSN